MPNFQQQVDPERSYMWTRNGSSAIKAIDVSYAIDGGSLVWVEGISEASGQVLRSSGFRMPLNDFEAMCVAFLMHLHMERKQVMRNSAAYAALQDAFTPLAEKMAVGYIRGQALLEALERLVKTCEDDGVIYRWPDLGLDLSEARAAIAYAKGE